MDNRMRMRQQVLLDHLKPETGRRTSADVVVSFRSAHRCCCGALIWEQSLTVVRLSFCFGF